MPLIKPHALRQIGYQLFETAGCPPESARAVVDHLVESSLYGHDSHGSLRIYEYIGQIQDGIFDPKGQPSIISDRPCAVAIDGGGAMGQIGGAFATFVVVCRWLRARRPEWWQRFVAAARRA